MSQRWICSNVMLCLVAGEILPLHTEHSESDVILVEGVEADHDSAKMVADLRQRSSSTR